MIILVEIYLRLETRLLAANSRVAAHEHLINSDDYSSSSNQLNKIIANLTKVSRMSYIS
jgi:hypothetical protein